MSNYQPHPGSSEAAGKKVMQQRNQMLSEQIIKAAQEKQMLQQKKMELQSEAKKYAQKIKQIEESRTWKATFPLRKTLDLIKHTKRRLAGGSSNVSSKKPAKSSSSRQTHNPNKKQEQRLKVIKSRLYNLGFTGQGLKELQEFHEQMQENPAMKKRTAWELAVWYINTQTKEGAASCLEFLQEAALLEKNQEKLRRIKIIEAECFALLERKQEAAELLETHMQKDTHQDLYFARANLEAEAAEKIRWLNAALEMYGLTPVHLQKAEGQTYYDSIQTEGKRQTPVEQQAAHKVSVIIPVYNAEKVLRTSLEAVLAQTWTNLEILAVDDCSTDSSREIINEYCSRDPRVKLVKAASNGGAYAARNLALQEAEGEFVTVNDADDWAHPEKIERQLLHLLEFPEVIGNISQQTRMTEDLNVFRRNQPGHYVIPNLSSLLFRRAPVVEELGCWDSVRFGADGEFNRRIKKVFGENALVNLETGPLSFQRQSADSLTASSAFGYPGFFMGARKEYFETFTAYHEHASSFKYEFPQRQRPFPVPEPMLPVRETKENGKRKLDIVLVSDFRLPGGTTMSNIEEIKAHKKLGYRTGLIQMARYDLRPRPINAKVQELIDGEQVQMLVYGENISCDLLILRHPPALEDWQKYIPAVEARKISVIANQTPKKDYGETNEVLYHIPRCAENLERYFGKPGTWYPIGPQIRQALLTHHPVELEQITLAEEDWSNIISLEEWKRPARPEDTSKIKIGRHSREHFLKWPPDPAELLQLYPRDEKFEIRILGGAEAPKQILGGLPDNWHVLEFGEMPPRDFLATLDVFVYYTNPTMVEAFGRVIIEAMAVGVPVIIPPIYEELFGNAAIYADPADVQEEINKLMDREKYYEQQVQAAHDYVEKNFGYRKHEERIGLGKKVPH
ncbi:glycosyltransferase [Alkalicoccus daliensis]|uniref:Glycosyl transferases group 1 n=1 Tax=Alkalicoccus daliensis TaxID=745820 RepID=A0A1H0GJG4_9BACI|nr:glycosyltransferase [Alkalicoccus daliensis]SDO07013.1 Glycosyl transferases group 1 [Alkalicoccus daliensis]